MLSDAQGIEIAFPLSFKHSKYDAAASHDDVILKIPAMLSATQERGS